MNYVGVAAFGMIITFLTLILPELRADDMRVCQLSHSYDVCFQALNR